MTYEEYKSLRPGDIIAHYSKKHYEVVECPQRFKRFEDEERFVWITGDKISFDGYNGFSYESCTIVSQKPTKSIDEFL